MTIYVLYNPFSAGGKGEEFAKELTALLGEDSLRFLDLTTLDYTAFFAGLEAEDRVILCGGDGTLNRFATDTKDIDYGRDIEYYAAGSGNDFFHDLGGKRGDAPVVITKYLRELPTVTVNGTESLFLNGVGYGLDGYCCEAGDEQRKKSDKPVNYTAIAIKALLFKYKPRNATVTVDGKSYSFRKVWVAPVMHGRFYGGGMMMAPGQKRNNEEGKLTLVVFYGTGKLKTLSIFPSVFEGKHIRHEKAFAVLEGKEFEVAFDRPTSLQIDGETILGVEKYSVKSAK